MKMNIKGLVFVGFAAAVFASAANADTGDKIVTSKTYVDSKYVGAANGHITVSPNETTGKNEISTDAEPNVQSDWNQSDTGADDFIKNKPTIPTVSDATVTVMQGSSQVGSFTLNAADGGTINIPTPEEQVQADWNESDNQDPSYIQNKPTIPTVNDPQVSVTQNGVSAGTFTLNQDSTGSVTIVAPDWNAAAGAQGAILNKPTIGAGTITVTQDGQTNQTFTVNDSGDTTISIAAPWTAPAANYCTAEKPCALVNDGTNITWERIQQ